MKIETKFFGEVEVEESGIVEFVKPILGFEDKKRFVLLEGIEDMIFTFFQSVDEPQLCFLTIPPSMVVEEYDIDLDDETVKLIGIESPADVLLYNIVTVPENVQNMSVNLKAPLIINLKNKKAAQEVLNNEEYSIRHKIVKAGE